MNVLGWIPMDLIDKSTLIDSDNGFGRFQQQVVTWRNAGKYLWGAVALLCHNELINSTHCVLLTPYGDLQLLFKIYLIPKLSDPYLNCWWSIFKTWRSEPKARHFANDDIIFFNNNYCILYNIEIRHQPRKWLGAIQEKNNWFIDADRCHQGPFAILNLSMDK